MFRRFKREFRYEDAQTGEKRRIPADWAGELEDEVAAAADAAGATFVDGSSRKSVRKTSLNDAELAKAEDAVVAAEKALADSKPDEKKAAQEKLETARANLAALQAA